MSKQPKVIANQDFPVATQVFPVAQASLVAQASPVAQASSEPLYTVDLPVGQDHGFIVQGSPPRISYVNLESPVYDGIVVGHYIHGLILPGIEIVNLTDHNQLTQLLEMNVANPRHILVSHNQYFIDPVIGSSTAGALYKHRLEADKYLGFTMEGFPPTIKFVDPNSSMVGRLHLGQRVEALLVPNQPVMNLAAGAFTSAKVQERMIATSHIEGRQLVMKDGVPTYGSERQQQQHRYGKGRQKGSNAAFDDCVIL
jgi:hypothetical protein